jgi:hypothetical protein
MHSIGEDTNRTDKLAGLQRFKQDGNPVIKSLAPVSGRKNWVYASASAAGIAAKIKLELRTIAISRIDCPSESASCLISRLIRKRLTKHPSPSASIHTEVFIEVPLSRSL